MPCAYATPMGFKQALENHLRKTSNARVGLVRRRQLLVFDRFLARMVRAFKGDFILKGGLVLEMRLAHARATIDIDLNFMKSPQHLLTRLQKAVELDLHDFMTFLIRKNNEHPQIRKSMLQYDGLRFRVECHIASKLYGEPFGVDIAFADPIFGKPDLMVCENTLGFAGIKPPQLSVYPVETHIAEKLHVYTLPRDRINSRVKDLSDLALLGCTGILEAARVKDAMHQTFAFRRTHALPLSFPGPPTLWERPYAAMAQANRLVWKNLSDVTAAVQTFLNPVLAGERQAIWDPYLWTWHIPASRNSLGCTRPVIAKE